ncbi:MAG: trigger factor [Firmicutes bacterium]|nr:trigger factor [Bacillota bacterium]
MKVDVERLEKSTVALTIEVEPEKVDDGMARAYRKVVGSVNVPGFRKGKAPRPILERHVGKATLLNEAFKIMFPEAYRNAVKESGVDPVDEPDVEVIELEEGKPLKFKATVAVKPEVQLGDYGSVKEKLEETPATPEEVDAELNLLRERQAQLVVDEAGVVKEDSYVTLDFQGYEGEKELPNSAAKDFLVPMGSGFLLPGFEEQIKGAKAGEERGVKVTLPADYKDKDLAGKEVTFKVKIKEVKRKELPALNDEFAKTQGEYADLQELKNEITNRLTQAKQQRAKAAHDEAVLKHVVDQATVDVPDVMVNRRAQSMLEDLLTRLERNKVTLREYMEGTGLTEETLKQQLLDAAARKVKTELVLEAISAKEGIKAEEPEVKQMVDGLAASTKQDGDRLFEQIRASGAIKSFERAITNDKVVAFLADAANKNATV